MRAAMLVPSWPMAIDLMVEMHFDGWSDGLDAYAELNAEDLTLWALVFPLSASNKPPGTLAEVSRRLHDLPELAREIASISEKAGAAFDGLGDRLQHNIRGDLAMVAAISAGVVDCYIANVLYQPTDQDDEPL